ncbi:MAG: hypothetical protein RLZZ385_2028 [Pseudomonadota bacterium]|jgi:trigger factor
MQVSIETTSGLERKMTIAVPSHEVESAVNERLQQAARNVRMNGFRQGKVPLRVIKDRYGKGVRQEVVGELMSKSYYEALSKESIKPAGQPRIEAKTIEEGRDLEFVATFEVYPEIRLPDFAAIKVEKLVAEVDDANIDKMVETLRQQRLTWQKVERESALKDMVNIDFSGTMNGEAFPGGSGKNTNLILGSQRMIPGFEDGLVGRKAGETVTLPLQFPADYHSAEFAGKDVEFTVTVNSVSEQVLPALDEEFFASFGIEEGGEPAFRDEVRQNMEREMKTASRNKLKNQAIDALLELVDVSVPKALVAGEIVSLRNQALQQMGGGKNVDPSLLPDSLFAEQAERRVISGLVLGEIIRQQNLRPDADKVREAVEEIAATYETPEEVVKWYYHNEEQLGNVESAVLEDQVFDLILSKATVEEKSVPYEKVIQAEPAARKAKNAKA